MYTIAENARTYLQRMCIKNAFLYQFFSLSVWPNVGMLKKMPGNRGAKGASGFTRKTK